MSHVLPGLRQRENCEKLIGDTTAHITSSRFGQIPPSTMMVAMIDNPFQLHRHSHHRRRVGVVNSNIDSDKIPLLDRERPQSPLETTRKKPLCETNAKPVKIVHFVRQATYYECPVSVSEEDIKRVWYNEEDYESFKRSALRAARDIRRNSSYLVAGIDHALEQSKRCAAEIQDQIELEHLLQSLPPPSRVRERRYGVSSCPSCVQRIVQYTNLQFVAETSRLVHG